ncbi:MAG: hypothetical protein ACKO8G_01925 [Actinomycetota bacterium]
MGKRSAAFAALALAMFQSLVLTAAPAGAVDLGVTADACYVDGGVIFAKGDGDAKPMRVSVGGTNLTCLVGTGGTAVTATFPFTAFTRVEILSEGPLTFDLRDTADPAPYRSASYPAVQYSVSALSVAFDGSGVDDSRYPVAVTIANTSFRIGSVGGSVVSVGSWSFVGTDGDDDLDARGLSNAAVIAGGGDGDDTLTGGGRGDLLTGGDGDDVLDGSDGDDLLEAGDGDDELRGGDGDDNLDCADSTADDEADQCWGEDDNDRILADLPSAGLDTVAPGDGNDDVNAAYVLTYADSSDPVEANIEDGEVRSDAGDDLFGPIAIFVGSPDADTISGSSDDETIRGGDGDDVLKGLGGDDVLGGGPGNDVLRGGAGADRAAGGGGDDRLVGGGGADILRGGGGEDLAAGGMGRDLCVAEKRRECEVS